MLSMASKLHRTMKIQTT